MRFVALLRAAPHALALIAALVLALPAAAQLRSLPANAKRAEMSRLQHPYIAFDGKTFRLAPGAVIYDRDNRTVLYGYLPASAEVVYQLDPAGHVIRVYMLTPAEEARLDRSRR